MTTVLLVEKNGTIKPLKIKDFCEEEFYKKCGYKSPSNFKQQHTWKTKVDGTIYYISLFAKTDSRIAMGENKYEFPPPVDNVLYFGTCLLAGYKNEDQPVSISVEIWNSIYNKLYGGFENLDDTAEKDDRERDELYHIPSHKKTKEGYLKDGFVVEEKTKKISSKKSNTSSATASPPISMSNKKKEAHPLSDEENEISEEDEDDDTTVYTDIDDAEDEDEEDRLSTAKGSKKKKETSVGSSKKKDLQSQKERDEQSMELLVSEFIITDELQEEAYLE
jgi:hypothetical protein